MARLLTSREPVPIDAIRREVVGYQDGEPEAVRKRFERDKRALRDMGVELVSIPPAGDDPGGYAIDRRCLATTSAALSPEELRLLALVSRHCPAEPGSALAANLQSALLKLSMGSGFDAGEIPAGQLGRLGRRPAGRPEVHDAVTEALLGGLSLELEYQGRSAGETTTRRVDPFGLGYFHGQWYLVGHCHLRRATRTFRLERIMGVPRAGRAATVPPPAGFRLEPYLERHAWEIGEGGLVRARVCVSRDVYWIARQRVAPDRCHDGADGGGTIEIDYADADRLLGWLAQFGRHARVESPPALAERRAEIAREIARRHAGPVEDAPRAAPPPDDAARRAKRKARRRAVAAEAGEAPRAGDAARLARILTLIPFLKRHQGIRLEELSNLSGTPVAELLLDLNGILMCGVPPYLPDDYIGVYVDDGVVTLRWADHFSAPVQLSLTEALALELALGRLDGPSGGEVVRALRSTVTAMLPKAVARSLSALAERVWVGAAAPAVGGPLLEGVARRVVLDAEYYSLSSGSLSRRRLHPLALVEHAGGLYLTAYCESRRDVRAFNASRFKSVVATDEPFVWEGPVPAAAPGFTADEGAERARVRFDASVTAELRDAFAGEVAIDAAGRGTVELPLLSSRWIATWLASYGPRFEVLAPQSLRDEMAGGDGL